MATRSRNSADTILRARCSISAKRKFACVKQCRCRSVPKSEMAKAAGSPVHCAGAFWGNHVLGAVAST